MAEPEHQVARGRVDTAPAAPSYQFGALMLGDGTARFRLWAPSVQAVTSELNGQPPLSMKRVDGGFHEVVCECAVGSRYRYRISADLCVPDPASRLQDGDVHSTACSLTRRPTPGAMPSGEAAPGPRPCCTKSIAVCWVGFAVCKSGLPTGVNWGSPLLN